MSGGSRGKNLAAKRSAKGVASSDAAPFLRKAAEWEGYVNVELSDGSAERYEAFARDADLVREVTSEVLLRGYKLSAVQVDDTETVRATAIQGFVGTPDAGLAVSAWEADIYDALAAVVYLVALHSEFDLSRWRAAETKKSRRTF